MIIKTLCITFPLNACHQNSRVSYGLMHSWLPCIWTAMFGEEREYSDDVDVML